MKLQELTDERAEEAIEKFHVDTSRFVNSVAMVVGNTRFTIPRSPRRLGNAVFPYFYAVDIYQLFRFARGQMAMSARYVDEKCDQILAILTTTVDGRRHPADWDTLRETPLGTCILACGARISLRREEGEVGLAEVILLSGWEKKRVAMSGLVPLDGEDVAFKSTDVREMFESHGIDV